ncbi:uncharacterized protein An17g02270, partial [Aspergillus niger]
MSPTRSAPLTSRPTSCGKAIPKPRPRLEPSPLPLQPVEHVPSTQGQFLNATASTTHNVSPAKAVRGSSSLFSGHGNLGYVPITAPPAPEFITDSPSKHPSFGYHHTAASSSSMPQSALFTTFSTSSSGKQSPKETQSSDEPNSDNFADFPEPSFIPKPLKRTLMDAAPLKERQTKKQKREEPSSMRLPEPHEMPPIEDDGTKPPYSYATLIGMSILRAPNRRLTLAQIYKWI